MKIVTERDEMKDWFKRYNDNYPHMHEIEKLNFETCNPKEIADIMIKHGIWTADCSNYRKSMWFKIKCDECEEYHSVVIQLGEEPDYESCTVDLCFDCFKSATKLVNDYNV